MPRITQEELSWIDCEWYGIDQKGQVAVFCSAGVANVPEYVCADWDRYERIVELFDELPVMSETFLCVEAVGRSSKQIEVCETFSGKGLYYYDSDDCSRPNVSTLKSYYTINSRPVTPIQIYKLPAEIQELLADAYLPIDDFGTMDRVEVKDAYSR